ncbi:hypothetical protein GCM10017764_29800 [Sphingobacterium griseoflavum]|uniref:histidine kinase n=2 Tax=Sphingobacterium griseoflavum TaxID=1474952 RepID=A0ABQ3I1G8_9SPHI|nr:hypothetical protein GCM10017764_29800 [Sphingobacterium griseoflavum]
MAFVYAALDTCASGVVITDARLSDNPIIYLNKAFEKMTGYSATEVIGRNCRFLQGKDRQQEGRSTLRAAMRLGREASVEIKNYTKDGRHFWNELHISPIRNKSGTITHFIGVQNDITARKDQEERVTMESMAAEREIARRAENLLISENYFKTIVETIGESMIVTDHHARIVNVNDSFLQTFKLTESEVLDKYLFDIATFSKLPVLREAISNLLVTEDRIKDLTIQHKFPYIGERTLKFNASRVQMEGLFKDRLLIVIDDITESKIFEKRKEDFLKMASHELKTPLTVIKGYIQLMSKMLVPSYQQMGNILDKSAGQVKRLEQLIDELLDVSKIDSGKLQVYNAIFNFDNMILEAVDRINNECAIPLVTVHGSTSIELDGDEVQLSQAFVNLLNNAIKFSPAHKPVEVNLANIKNHIKVSVKDHGIGIHVSDQEKIFERFYRASHTQEKFPGMGIGLYLTETVIKQHGGSIWVDSEPDQGATFSFILPLDTKQRSPYD